MCSQVLQCTFTSFCRAPQAQRALILHGFFVLFLLFALFVVQPSLANADPPTQSSTATLRLINDSDHTVCYVLISTVTASEWGEDWLDDDTIPPGQSYSFELAPGDYDVLLADCSQNPLLEEYGLSITEVYELRLTASDPSCETLNQAGMALYGQARYIDALEQFQQANTCYQEIGDRAGEGTTLNNIGGIHHYLGRYEQALVYYQQGLSIRKEIGDRAGEGGSLNNIGAIYESLGQYEPALETYQQSLSIRQEIGDRAGEGTTLNNIGGIYDSLGQYELALETYQQSLSILQEIGDRAGEGVTLSNIGGIYHSLGQYEQALETYQQSLSISQEIGDRAGEGITLNNIGAIYESLGQYEPALEYLQQSLSISQEIGNRATEGATLNNIGGIYHSLGQYEQALEYHLQSLSILKEIGDRAGEGIVLNSIGLVYASLGQYELALDTYQQSLSIRKEIGDRAGEGVTLNNIGAIYDSLGQYEPALDTYQQSLSIRQEIGDRAGEGESLNNIGLVYASLGHYEQALETYQQSLSILKEIGDRTAEGTVLNSIGLIYRRLGQYEKALEYYQQSLGILQEIGDRAREGGSLNNIGLIYARLGQYPPALEYYQQSLSIRQEIGDRAGEGITLNNIGAIYESLGQYEPALEYLQQSLTIAQEIGDRAGEGVTLSNIGGIYHSLGQYEQALEYYQQSLGILKEIGDRAGEGVTLNNIGAIYDSLGQYEPALRYYQDATEMLESVRAQAGGEQGRAGFIAQYADMYRRTVDLYHQQDRDGEAFFTTERGRARAFLDSLATGQVRLSEDDAADLLAQEGEAYAQRQTLRFVLAEARAADPPDPDRLADLEAELAEAEAAYQDVQEAIAARGAELAALVPGRNQDYLLSVSRVQELLDEETTLISYFVLEDNTLAFIITREDFDTVSLEVTPEQLLTQIRDFRDFADPSFPAYPTSVITLYGWLIEPLEEHLDTLHLVIIPHSVLHYLPFAALTGGERYLIDDYVLTTLPSASALPFIQDNVTALPSPGGRGAGGEGLPLILGNPVTGDFDATASFATTRDGLGALPFAEKEAKVIAALYGIKPLLGKDATEGVVRQRAAAASILHLAAHGFYNPVAPLSSLIALAPDDPSTGSEQVANDGWLTVGEVYGLDLSNAELVVLSACQSNLGDLSEGDELVGLTRAFIFAGTPTVIASLWSVDDETSALLMERFYTHLRDGMGKAEALRQAQLEVREEYPNPYYWAAFVLSGDGGEIGDIPPITSEEAAKAEEVEATPALASPESTGITPPPSEAGAKEKRTSGCVSMILPLGLMGLVLWRRRAVSV